MRFAWLALGALAFACASETVGDVARIETDCTRGTAWKPTCTRIDVEWRFFGVGPGEGWSGYERSRSDLSSAQLGALGGLCAYLPVRSMLPDSQAVYVRITDADGSVARYRAATENRFDSYYQDLPVIEFGSLRPFLDTAHCLFSGATSDQANTISIDPITGQPGPPWVNAPIANDTPGCVHGVSGQLDCADVWITLTVSATGHYSLRNGACLGMRVLTGNGATELASVKKSLACPALEYDFPSAGPYLVAFGGACGGSFEFRATRSP